MYILLVSATLIAQTALAVSLPRELSTTTVAAVMDNPQFNDYPGLTDALAKSPDRNLRVWAYQQIQNRGHSEAFDALMKAYPTETNPQVQSVILHALWHFATQTRREIDRHGIAVPNAYLMPDEARKNLFALLRAESAQDRPWYARKTAIYLMGSLHQPEAAEIILAATNDPMPDVRNTALNSLVHLYSPEHRDFWLRQLKEGSPEMKRRAVAGLAGQSDPEIESALQEARKTAGKELLFDVDNDIDMRSHRREIADRMKNFRVTPPTFWTMASAKLIEVVWSSGMNAAYILLLPCILAAIWAFKNKEVFTAVASSYFIGAFLAMRFGVLSHPNTQLSLVLLATILLLISSTWNLVRLRSKAPVMDLALLPGIIMVAISIIRHSLPTFVYAGTAFAFSILVGAVLALYLLIRKNHSGSAYCIAYASVLSLLLAVLPVAFRDM